MWKRTLRSFLQGPRDLNAETTPNDVSLSNVQARVINPKLFPEGLCTSCQNLTIDRLMETQCWFEYGRNTRTRCPMCRVILGSILTNPGSRMTENIRIGLTFEDAKWNYIGRQRWENIREVHVSRYRDPRVAFDMPGTPQTHGRFRIYAEPGSYASRFVPVSRAPCSNLSDATFQKICSWTKECDETHTSCWENSWESTEAETRCMPTRVVHVGSATRQPRLYIPRIHQMDRYIALSHCWGNGPQKRTLNANIELFQKEIMLEDLSKTFQDAIRVARRLNIEYIWIDSLCIVQDNKMDWIRESERMGTVYANAYVTIAATWTPDGSGGLDSTRPHCNWIRLPCEGTDESKGYMWFTDASWTPQTDLDDAPLNKRGWVFQEKVLSRRIIHFASSQVYWECKLCIFGQEGDDKFGLTVNPVTSSEFWGCVKAIPHLGTIPIERRSNPREVSYLTSPLGRFHAIWRTFVRYYCVRNFTKQSDRLIALLGIVRVVEKQTGLRCVDGHWNDGTSQFVRELMWFPKEQRTLSVLDDDRQSRLCSSWSWASLEGSIANQFNPEPPDYFLRDPFLGGHYPSSKRYIESWDDYGLKECDLHLKAIEDKIHAPWPSYPLKVSGMLISMYKSELSWNYDETSSRRQFSVKVADSGGTIGWVCFDRRDEEPDKFHFSPLYICEEGVPCLALVQRNRPEIAERCFERVGAGLIESQREWGNSIYLGKVQSKLFETSKRLTYYII